MAIRDVHDVVTRFPEAEFNALQGKARQEEMSILRKETKVFISAQDLRTEAEKGEKIADKLRVFAKTAKSSLKNIRVLLKDPKGLDIVARESHVSRSEKKQELLNTAKRFENAVKEAEEEAKVLMRDAKKMRKEVNTMIHDSSRGIVGRVKSLISRLLKILKTSLSKLSSKEKIEKVKQAKDYVEELDDVLSAMVYIEQQEEAEQALKAVAGFEKAVQVLKKTVKFVDEAENDMKAPAERKALEGLRKTVLGCQTRIRKQVALSDRLTKMEKMEGDRFIKAADQWLEEEDLLRADFLKIGAGAYRLDMMKKQLQETVETKLYELDPSKVGKEVEDAMTELSIRLLEWAQA